MHCYQTEAINLLTSSGVMALADLFPSDLLFFLLSSLVLYLFLTMAAACLFILLFYYCIIFSSQFIVFHPQYLF